MLPGMRRLRGILFIMLVGLMVSGLAVAIMAGHPTSGQGRRSATPPTSASAWTNLSVPEMPSAARSPIHQIPAGWTQLAVPADSADARRLHDLTFGDNVETWFLGSNAGLYRTLDNGHTWQRIPVAAIPARRRNSPAVLAVAAGFDGRLYVGNDTDPILASADGGQTWTAGTHLVGADLVVAPSDPRVVYGMLGTPSIHGPLGLVQSTDGGLTWELRPGGPSGGYLAVDPTDAETLYHVSGASRQIFRSHDGGRTFESWLIELSWNARDGPAGLAISAHDGRMWLLTHHGQVALSGDQGRSWETVSAFPGEGTLRALAASPQDPQRIWIITAEGQLWEYRHEAERAG
jgi:photosystem II stability/assembly factor-like uncharacterized protein